MKHLEVGVLSDAVNNWVVQTPGRMHPGVVIQGDNLVQLRDLAAKVMRLGTQTKNDELRDAAEELHELLDAKVVHLERTLTDSGLTAIEEGREPSP